MIVALRQLWTDHSLTITLTALGTLCLAIAVWHVWPLEPDRWFDIWSGFSAGLLTVALFYSLAGRLRERNKPEE